MCEEIIHLEDWAIIVAAMERTNKNVNEENCDKSKSVEWTGKAETRNAEFLAVGQACTSYILVCSRLDTKNYI